MANLASPISVRFSLAERAVLDVAVEQARTNLSDFIRRKVIEAAEQDVLDRRQVIIPAADWAKFEDWVNAPAKDIPALRQLASTPPVWQD